MSTGSLLETFFILFQSDAEEVDQGAKEAKDSTEKLEKKLNDVDRSAKKAGDSFSDLAKKAVNVLLPFAGLAAMKGAIVDFATGADEAGKLAKALRMDVEEMQAWQGAAIRAGGDANGMAGSIKALNDKLFEMQRTGFGGDAGVVFRRLGVSIRDSEGKLKGAGAMLLDLSDKFAGLSRERAVRLGEKLGLDGGTIDLLQKGRKGVEDLMARQKELGVYSKKDAEDARKFNNSLADLGQVFKSVSAVVVGFILPVFTSMSEGLTTAAINVRKHQDLITGFFIALGVIMGVLAFKTLIAFSPFFLMLGVVLLVAGAFAILYDDVMNFLGGHDSIIGRLSKDYPWIADLVHDVVAAFKSLWEIAKAVGTLLVDSIASPTQAWENFMNTVGPIIDGFTERFPILGQAIQDLGSIFKWLFELVWPILKKIGEIIASVIGSLVEGLATIGGWLGKALSWVAGKIKGEASLEVKNPEPDLLDQDKGAKAREQQAVADPYDLMTPGQIPPDLSADLAKGKQALAQTNVPISAMASGAAGKANQVNKTTTVSVGKVEVHTQATDAEGMAGAAGGALESQLRNAVDNWDDGVLA